MKQSTKSTRIHPVREIIKSIILACLLVSLILLVGVYISGMQVYEKALAQRSGESFERLWSVQSEAAPEGLESVRLMPEFIGYKQASMPSPRAALAHRGAISELYKITKSCLSELFGKQSVCRELTAENGRLLFETACGENEFVYLRYYTPVLYQLIYAYAADDLTVSENDVAMGQNGIVSAYISDIIIIPDKDFAAHRFVAYATDRNGHFFEFRPSDHIVSSSFYISALAEMGTSVTSYDFTFASHERLSLPEPIVNAGVEYGCIELSSVPVNGEDVQNGLLSLFGYNLSKLDSYTDENGYVFVDTHSQLRLEEGLVHFLADDAEGDTSSLRGISIDTLLGYSRSDTSGLFDKLTAVDNLIKKISRISPILTGDEALLCLGDVYTDDGLLVIEYIPTYDGVRIGSEPYLRAVLTEQTVCEVTLHPVAASSGAEAGLALPPTFVLEGLDGVGTLPSDKAISTVRLRYTGADAEWLVNLK